MANYKITPEDSRYGSSSGFAAYFNPGTAGADTLTIDDGAYVISSGLSSAAVHLLAPGAWTVNVNGAIYAQANDSVGIWLENGAVNSTINIGAAGSIGSRLHSAIVM